MQGVKNDIFRGRRKLAAFLREEVRSYSSSVREYQEELDELSAFFP